MAEVDVKNLKNEVVGRLELDDSVFGYSASETLVWEAVKAYQAGQRKGTHATKVRSEVSGSGRKLWRQKGTGRARVGSIRSSIWRKGGTVHGPQPRDHGEAFPKRKRRGAIKVVLTDKLKNERITVVENFDFPTHRTRDFLEVLGKLQLDRKILVVDDQDNRNLYLGSRNLPEVKAVRSLGVNVYDLLHYDHLLISRDAVLKLQEILQR